MSHACHHSNAGGNHFGDGESNEGPRILGGQVAHGQHQASHQRKRHRRPIVLHFAP